MKTIQDYIPDIYSKIERMDYSKRQMKKRLNDRSVRVCCCLCKRTDKTLLKRNEHYICKDCAKNSWEEMK